MTRYCEFPEPVIAAYLQAVRALPLPAMEENLSAAFNARSKTSPFRAQVPLRFAAWALAITARMSIASATWTVRDLGAKLAYRSLLTELSQRGWPSEARQKVLHGLNALRGRELTGASGERLYELSMEASVPRSTIGWR